MKKIIMLVVAIIVLSGIGAIVHYSNAIQNEVEAHDKRVQEHGIMSGADVNLDAKSIAKIKGL